MARPTVQVTGLNEFRRSLKAVDSDLPKALRLALNTSGQIIVDDARPRIDSVTGTARGTVKVRSTQTKVRVVGGGKKAPYYPWLDFGGKIRRASRPFLKNGRYIYNAYFRRRDEFAEVLEDSILAVARSAGWEVTKNG